MSSDSSKKCFIHCKNVQFSIPFETFEGREELVGIPFGLQFVSNDPTLFPV
jgi:hypothetical protein